MRELVDKQFNIEFTYDIETETPREALELALLSVDVRSGSCWVVITTPEETEENSFRWEGWLSDYSELGKGFV